MHRAAPVALVFLNFPSQLNSLPPGSVGPHSHGHGPAGSPPGGQGFVPCTPQLQALGTPHFSYNGMTFLLKGMKNPCMS